MRPRWVYLSKSLEMGIYRRANQGFSFFVMGNCKGKIRIPYSDWVLGLLGFDWKTDVFRKPCCDPIKIGPRKNQNPGPRTKKKNLELGTDSATLNGAKAVWALCWDR